MPHFEDASVTGSGGAASLDERVPPNLGRSPWRRLKRIALYLVGFIVISVAVAGGFLWYRLNAMFAPTPLRVSRTLMSYAAEAGPAAPIAPVAKPFDWNAVDKAAPGTAPWVRWWWPGADVDATELRRELALLRTAGFGGAEIQPFAFGITPVTEHDPLAKARVFGVDTPRYFKLVQGVIRDAERLGLQIDLTHYSGWPAGSPVVTPADGTQSLAWSEMRFSGGKTVDLELPRPAPGKNAYLNAALSLFVGGHAGDFDPQAAKLISVVVARPIGGGHSIFSLGNSLAVDPNTVQVIDARVKNGRLSWAAPAGDWVAIASWIMPTGEQSTLAGMNAPTYVVDVLNKPAITAHYNYVFGNRSGLSPYYGRGLRAFFNDSLEFKADRLSSRDFLTEFSQRRGYDLRPWLPAVYKDGVDNFYWGEILPAVAPSFKLSGDDQRVRYDYQLTLSELITERFVAGSQQWASAHRLLSRGQSYGMDLDTIRALGANDIPETEQLYAGGSQAFLRLASSAALLYGRSLVSSESFVWADQDYASSGAKLKLATDRLFLAGVNHIIYHGYPYDWRRGDRSKFFSSVGWDPWSSPERKIFTFSGNYSERTPLWKDIVGLNSYIARAQNILRQGKQHADVLIYYPYLGFKNSGYGQQDTHEPLMFGEFPLTDPTGNVTNRKPDGKASNDQMVAWLRKVQPMLDELDARGITWSWVNGQGIRDELRPGGRTRSGGSYGGLIFADAEAVAPADLSAGQRLFAAGTPVFLHGAVPERQPGFHDRTVGDARVRLIARALAGPSGAPRDPRLFAESVKRRVRPRTSYSPSGDIRRYERILDNKGSIEFFVNHSMHPASIVLQTTGDRWWFDAMTGAVAPATIGASGQLTLTLAPLESRFLIGGVPMPAGPAKSMRISGSISRDIALSGWKVTTGSISRMGLFNWSTDARFRYLLGSASYKASFVVPTLVPGAQYLLTLPPQPGTAVANVNGRRVGLVSLPPGIVDIGNAIKPGTNEIEIVYRQPVRNSLIGQWVNGDKRLAQFKGREAALVPAGIRGKIRVVEIIRNQPAKVGD